MQGLEEEWRSASKHKFQQNALLPSVPLHVVRAYFKNQPSGGQSCLCNTVLWGFCGWLRMLAFQWVVYRVVDLGKQLPRQLSLGQDRADTAML